MIAVPPDGQAFFICPARLFDVDIDVANRFYHAESIMPEPTGVSVGNEPVARLELRGDGMNSLNIDIRIAAHFELEPSIPFGPIAGDALSHCFRRFLGN